MTRFIDGPAAGQTLCLRRAPRYIRAVRSRSGEWDALDQPGDEPKPAEAVCAYELAGEPTRVHIKAQKRGASGWFAVASYIYADGQPDDATMRDRAKWEAWCKAHDARINTGAGI